MRSRVIEFKQDLERLPIKGDGPRWDCKADACFESCRTAEGPFRVGEYRTRQQCHVSLELHKSVSLILRLVDIPDETAGNCRRGAYSACTRSSVQILNQLSGLENVKILDSGFGASK